MSARFFKIISGVTVAHLVVLIVVWVGFSAPLPRPPVTFYYGGVASVEDTESPQEDAWQKGNVPDQLTLDHPDASYSNQWVSLRAPSRPSAYDHLGF